MRKSILRGAKTCPPRCITSFPRSPWECISDNIHRTFRGKPGDINRFLSALSAEGLNFLFADFVGEGPLPIDVPPLTVPVFADMDGDGDLDLLVGNAGGGVIYFRNSADSG